MNAQIQTQKKSLEKKKVEVPVQETLKTRPEISLLDLTERLPSADRYILDLKSLMNYFIDKKIEIEEKMKEFKVPEIQKRIFRYEFVLNYLSKPNN